MASGKTTVGEMVADSLGWPYVDNDDRLMERTGRSPREIEEEDGIGALHALEATLLLESLAEDGPAVVAAAASTVEDAACREALRQRAFTVWVKAPPAQIAAKAAESVERPKMGVDLEALAAERAPAYQGIANLTVDTAALGREQAAEVIVASVRDRFGF